MLRGASIAAMSLYKIVAAIATTTRKSPIMKIRALCRDSLGVVSMVRVFILDYDK